MIVQEVVNWGCNELIDCLSLFGRADRDPGERPVYLRNSHYMDEAKLIGEFQSHYTTQNVSRNARPGLIQADMMPTSGGRQRRGTDRLLSRAVSYCAGIFRQRSDWNDG